ncbi:MAG: CerR family C-terminal domain-containing protein [Burkholderiaceae bacterium]
MTKPRRTPRIDGELTRARILEAAGKSFAAAGYAETASKTIAAQAGVDLALINYHFGGRRGLYRAVLSEAHRRIISLDDLQRIAASERPAREKLAWCLDSLVDAAIGNDGWHARIFARELLSPSSNLQVLYEQDLEPKFVVIRRILSEVTGIPEDNPALLRCMISIAAPCLMLLVAGNGSLPGPPQQVLQMPRKDLVSHLHRFAFAGLEAIGRDHAERARQSRPGRSGAEGT